MNLTKTVPTTVLAALVLAAPALADAPVKWSAPVVAAKAGEKSPVTVPGTGLKQGAKVRSGESLIRRTATVDGREGSTRLVCTGGRKLEGIAVSETAKVSIQLGAIKNYVGKTNVIVTASEKGGKPGKGSVYALCG